MLKLQKAIAVCSFAAGLLAQERPSSAPQSSSWDPKSAANYLDSRLQWWSTWPTASRDHQTFCISCHTAAPYAAARSSLRTALGERSLVPVEQKLVDNVIARVRQWD